MNEEDEFEDFIEDEGEDINEIQKMFSQILKSDVNIVDSFNLDKENSIGAFLEQLNISFLIEDEIYGNAGIDISRITDPLWLVIENSFILLYGKEITNLIIWYIFHRTTEDGKIRPFIDSDDKEFIFNNENEFIEYIKHRFPDLFS